MARPMNRHMRPMIFCKTRVYIIYSCDSFCLFEALPNDIFNAFNGLNREVSSLASAMKSSHKVYMNDQLKQQQQQQDEGSRRSKGVDTTLEIQTLKKSVTEAEKSEARAQQLQKVAEQERTQALTNLAAFSTKYNASADCSSNSCGKTCRGGCAGDAYTASYVYGTAVRQPKGIQYTC